MRDTQRFHYVPSTSLALKQNLCPCLGLLQHGCEAMADCRRSAEAEIAPWSCRMPLPQRSLQKHLHGTYSRDPLARLHRQSPQAMWTGQRRPQRHSQPGEQQRWQKQGNDADASSKNTSAGVPPDHGRGHAAGLSCYISSQPKCGRQFHRFGHTTHTKLFMVRAVAKDFLSAHSYRVGPSSIVLEVKSKSVTNQLHSGRCASKLTATASISRPSSSSLLNTVVLPGFAGPFITISFHGLPITLPRPSSGQKA